MRSTAAINTRVSFDLTCRGVCDLIDVFVLILMDQLSTTSGGGESYGILYAVVAVLPSDEGYTACSSTGQAATDHLFSSGSSNDVPINSTIFSRPDEREKQITITVLPALTSEFVSVPVVR